MRRVNDIGVSAILVAAMASLLALAVLADPRSTVEASVAGLRLWWEVVFPSLLPFFILSELLLGLGVVHWLGTILDPAMRPIFNVSGPGGFALALGLASGYPMGPKIAAQLCKEGLITRVEGERLAAFSNCAGPLYISGAVAVGMLHAPEAGLPLAIAHYAAAIVTGLVMRHWGRECPPSQEAFAKRQSRSIISRATDNLLAARRADPRPFGQLLADSVRDGVNTLLGIGGFIVFFSVILSTLSRLGWLGMLAQPFTVLLRLLGGHPSLATPLARGFLEVTAGSQSVASAGVPLLQRSIAASAVLAWAGLCVHSQAVAAMSPASMRYAPFALGRLLQAIFSVGFASLLLGPLRLSVSTLTLLPTVTSPLTTVAWTACLALLWLGLLLLASLIARAMGVARRRLDFVIVTPRSLRH